MKVTALTPEGGLEGGSCALGDAVGPDVVITAAISMNPSSCVQDAFGFVNLKKAA